MHCQDVALKPVSFFLKKLDIKHIRYVRIGLKIPFVYHQDVALEVFEGDLVDSGKKLVYIGLS